MSRSPLLFAQRSAAFASPGLACGTLHAAEKARASSNGLFIAGDDMNDWVGAFGGVPQQRSTTPKLDQFAKEHAGARRYFIAVEGFTDAVGNAEYNEALSRRRANRVVAYLVTKHDIPVYRIQMIGLGKEKPLDEGRNRAARARNRRVEVKLYTADANSTLSQL